VIRTFLAVELSETLRRHLSQIQQDLKQSLSPHLTHDVRLSWVQPASIHLTIKFFGDTDERVVDPLREALEPVVTAHVPITIPLERLGAFPRVQQPRVLWIGPSEQWEQGDDAERLAALHRAVEDGCERFGFAAEGRRLSPHLTLARIKEGERQVGQAMANSGVLDRPLAIGSLSAASVALMKSELRPTGPVYTRLWEVR